jgi:8-oxo-dGTP diphosphatase
MEGVVRVGLGVLIVRDDKVLMLKRKGSHGEGTWSLPGGHLEIGESFSDCARREMMEELGVEIEPHSVISVSNDIMYGKHYITIGVKAAIRSGEIMNNEPHKCEAIRWFKLDELPSPLFVASKNVIEIFQSGSVVRPL